MPTGQAGEEERVRRVARFVPGIGQCLADQVAMVEDIQNRTLRTVSPPGAIEVVMQDGEMRYRVKDQVWFQGMDFDAFMRFLIEKLGQPQDKSPYVRSQVIAENTARPVVLE